MSHPLFTPNRGTISASMIERFDSFLKRVQAGEIRTYPDLVFSGFVQP
jgi:hypothetical protein